MKKIISKLKGQSQEQQTQPAGMQIGSPQDLILQIPRPRLDANGVPIQAIDFEIDSATMRAALAHMSSFLSERGQTITVVGIGGIVNLLLLQSRQSTHDVDFFGTNINNAQRVALDEAAAYADSQAGGSLGIEWFNNQTQMWLSPNIHRQLTQQALEQAEVVFRMPSLTVVAAPWHYAFAAKANRIAQDRRGEQRARARPYDASDAAAYLHRYIQRAGGRPLEFKVAQNWCREYGLQVEMSVLKTINDEYKRKYQRNGLV